jgi:hypothetical protein
MVEALGVPISRNGQDRPIYGVAPLADDLDAEWAQDRVDLRRLVAEYPRACFTLDNGPCHKLVTTPEHKPVIIATLNDLKKSHAAAQEKGWEMYANDLGDQIKGMEQVVRELDRPDGERLRNLGLHKKFANRRGVVPGIGDTPNDHHREALAGLPHDHHGGAGELINQVDRGIPQPAEQVIPLVLLEMTDTGESYRHPDGPVPIGFTEAVGDDDSDITAGERPQRVSYRPRARVGITRQQ